MHDISLSLCHCTDILGCCRANNHVQRAPNGAGGESPSDVHIDDDPNAYCEELPGNHWDGCRCGMCKDTNDHFNSDCGHDYNADDMRAATEIVAMRIAIRFK